MKKILLFLSKTDIEIYNACPLSAKNTQLAFGIFVLLTGILAFCSGTYAFSNLFIELDEQLKPIYTNLAYIIAPLLGLLYTLMIIFIDREVVAARSKGAAFSRLLLAIIIGTIVAIPIELRLLKDRIEKEILENHREQIRPFQEIRDSKLGILESKRETEKTRLKEKIEKSQDKISYWQEIMQREGGGISIEGITTGKGGEGPAWRGARDNLKLHQANKKEALSQYDTFLKDTIGYYNEKNRILENYKSKIINPSFDLLAQFQALNKLIYKEEKKESEANSALWLSWGIRILFILFEIIPSLIKLMTPPTEYDILIKTRLHMNKQLAFARANDALLEMEEDIQNIVSDPKTEPLPFMSQIKNRIMN